MISDGVPKGIAAAPSREKYLEEIRLLKAELAEQARVNICLIDENKKLREEMEEILSYLPKIPTQPYEKELAMEVARLKEELDRAKNQFVLLLHDPK